MSVMREPQITITRPRAELYAPAEDRVLVEQTREAFGSARALARS